MNHACHTTNVQHLTFQRNVSLALSLLLGLALLGVTTLLLFKTERVVVIPQGCEKEIWIEKNRVSNHYLERQAEIIISLLLNKSPATISNQREFLLTLAEPSFYGPLKRKLMEEEKMLKKQGASFVFIPLEITADNETMKVKVVGDRMTYLGEKKVESKREQYIFAFRFNGTTLLLTEIERNEVKVV